MANKPTSYRFQVSCSYCGMLESFTNFNDAVTYANKMQKTQHNNPCENVEVFDLLAHSGKPDLFDYLGDIKSIKA